MCTFGFDNILEVAYLTFKSIFHKAFNLFYFDCEITLESVPGTNQLEPMTDTLRVRPATLKANLVKFCIFV